MAYIYMPTGKESNTATAFVYMPSVSKGLRSTKDKGPSPAHLNVDQPLQDLGHPSLTITDLPHNQVEGSL